jgi:hypothetical protein
MIETLASMGLEGVAMCKYFVTENDLADFLIDSEELQDMVMNKFAENENYREADEADARTFGYDGHDAP